MLRSFSKLSFKSSQPSSSSLNENLSHNLSRKVFKEEIHFEDINQDLDSWEIPRISHNEIYKPNGSFSKDQITSSELSNKNIKSKK
jgi:hypothetical protein